MRTFAKPLLLAASIGMVCTTAVAGTVAVTTQIHSTEGLVGVTSTQTSNAITYTLGSAYAGSDQITLTFNEDVLSNTTFPSQITVDAVDSATEEDAIAGMVLGFVDSTSTSATYRVTTVSQPDDTPGDGGTLYNSRTTLGAVVPIGTVNYSPAAILSGVSVTVTSATSTDGPIDSSGTPTAILAETKTQFGSATVSTVFDAVIDVSAERKVFTPTGSDALGFAITNPDTSGWQNLATLNSTSGLVLTLAGGTGKLAGLKDTDFSSSNSGTFVVSEDASSIVTTYNSTFESDIITFTPPTDVELSTQTFTATVAYNYTSAGGTAGTATIGNALAAGAWTLNGANVVIPYMPYSATASQIIYVTNTGKTSGDILVTATGAGGISFDLGVVSSSPAGGLVKLSKSIKDALTAQGFDSGKLTLTLTVQVPSDDIIVYASYNIGGSDRGFVNTDQYINNTK